MQRAQVVKIKKIKKSTIKIHINPTQTQTKQQ